MGTAQALCSKIIHTLAHYPINYEEELALMGKKQNSDNGWSGSGVLLILTFPPDPRGIGDVSVLLNKRSQRVRQAGDLCFPGGGATPYLDRFLSRLMDTKLLPLSRNKAFRTAKGKGKEHFRTIAFYLTVALREAWEEIRLNPFSIDFLGPLPCYHLELFQRILFPMVVAIHGPLRFKPNWEVDRVFTTPLDTFFHRENYALYSIDVEGELRDRIGEDVWEFPCVLVNDHGKREILWGATFNVTLSFLRAVFGFEPPAPPAHRRIRAGLDSGYLSGSQE